MTLRNPGSHPILSHEPIPFTKHLSGVVNALESGRPLGFATCGVNRFAMLILSCNQLSRGFDREPLFEDISFELQAGERVGLVGPNGCGKSTLMRILAGVDQPDTGDVRLHAGARLGFLTQTHSVSPGKTLIEEAREALKPLYQAQEELVAAAEALAHATGAEHDSLAQKYDRLHEVVRHHDAFELEHRVEKVLEGLGFEEGDRDRPVETFSGGQISRLMLAKLLLAAPDLLLLDEPSNHLDIATTRWLEKWLANQPEAMLIVSHDRVFLDRVATRVFEMSNHRIDEYPGNFTAYWRLRKERHEAALKAYEQQKEYIDKQEEYIKRVNYGQLHKQAASRQKQIDKIERLEKPVLVSAPRMTFGEVNRAGDVVIDVERLSKAYGPLKLFSHLTFQLQRGKRLGIAGPNGSGKTTLLRILLGEEKADKGIARVGHQVEIGYFDQHLALLDESLTATRAAWPPGQPDMTEQRMRDLLGRFGIAGAEVEQTVRNLSGGQKSRVALARLVARGVNLLILDEPTNHLDLWACEALEDALLGFDGTVIVVSHDRWFLNRIVDQMLILDGQGHIEAVYGNFDMYERLVDSRTKADAQAQAKKPAQKAQGEAKSNAVATSPAGKKKWKYSFRKVEEIEADVSTTEDRIEELEAELVSPETYKDGLKVKAVQVELEGQKERLAELYEHWEEMMERLK